MVPALARWNGDHAMTSDTTKEAAVAAEGLFFDDWFDAIEDGSELGCAASSRRCWKRN